MSKRAAPHLTRAAARLDLVPALDSAVMYAHFLLGQGSGTGWDIGEYAVAANHLRGVEAPVVVEVGANWGRWTTRVRRQSGSNKGRWLLFEPTEQCQAALTRIDNAELGQVAGGEHEEQRDLFGTYSCRAATSSSVSRLEGDW